MKKIIIPTDFSEVSFNALHYALGLFKGKTVEILLVHLVEIPVPAGLEFGIVNGKTASDQLQLTATQAANRLDSIIRENELADLNVDYQVETGSLSYWYSHCLPALKADMIIMGTAGASGLRKIFTGTNAARAVRMACCPVLTIPASIRYKRIKSILVPVTHKFLPANFLDALKQLQSSTRAILQVIWIRTPHFAGKEEEVISEIISLFSHIGISNFQLNTRRSFSVESGIETFLQECQADLLAMPTHGRKGLSHLLRGSITGKTVQNLPVPVWSLSCLEQEDQNVAYLHKIEEEK